MKREAESDKDDDFSAPDILMASPEFFDVDYEINPHMDEEIDVDKEAALEQWTELKTKYEKELGYDVHVVDGVEGLLDMVFAANQGFAFEQDGEVKVLPAKMKHEERYGEVEKVVKDLEQLGIETLDEPDYVFEGSGDAMQHPEEGEIWVGYGQRTEEEAVEEISEATGLETHGIRLETEDFYHLDTCFEHLDDDTALIYSDAIADEDIDEIVDAYGGEENLIEVAENEEYDLAANAHCPDGENVIIHEEASETINKLEEEGFNVIPTDTSEYLKSGGSVYCMKLQLKDPASADINYTAG